MYAILQLVSAPLNPIPIAEHFRRSHPQCEHSYRQHVYMSKENTFRTSWSVDRVKSKAESESETLVSGLTTEHYMYIIYTTYLPKKSIAIKYLLQTHMLSLSDSYRRKQLIPCLFTTSGGTSEVIHGRRFISQRILLLIISVVFTPITTSANIFSEDVTG